METQVICCEGDSRGSEEETTGSIVASDISGLLDTDQKHHQLSAEFDFTEDSCRFESDCMLPCSTLTISEEQTSQSQFSDAVSMSSMCTDGDRILTSSVQYTDNSDPGARPIDAARVSACADTIRKSAVLFTSPSTSVLASDVISNKDFVNQHKFVECAKLEQNRAQEQSLDITKSNTQDFAYRQPVVIGNAGAASFVQNVLNDLKTVSVVQSQPPAGFKGVAASTGYILLSKPTIMSVMHAASGTMTSGTPVIIQLPHSSLPPLSTQGNVSAINPQSISTASHLHTLTPMSPLSGVASPAEEQSISSTSRVASFNDPVVTSADQIHRQHITTNDFKAMAVTETCDKLETCAPEPSKYLEQTSDRRMQSATPFQRVEQAVVISRVKPSSKGGKGMQQIINHFMQQNHKHSHSHHPGMDLPTVMNLSTDKEKEHRSGMNVETVESRTLGSQLRAESDQLSKDTWSDSGPNSPNVHDFFAGEMSQSGNGCSLQTSVASQSHPSTCSQSILHNATFFPAWSGCQLQGSNSLVLILREVDHSDSSAAAALTSLHAGGYRQVFDNSEPGELPTVSLFNHREHGLCGVSHDEVDGVSTSSILPRSQSFIQVLSSVALEQPLSTQEQQSASPQQSYEAQEWSSAAQEQQSVTTLQPVAVHDWSSAIQEQSVALQKQAVAAQVVTLQGQPLPAQEQLSVSPVQQPLVATEHNTSVTGEQPFSDSDVSEHFGYLSRSSTRKRSRSREVTSMGSEDSTLHEKVINTEGMCSATSHSKDPKDTQRTAPTETAGKGAFRPIILCIVQEDGSTRDVSINPVEPTSTCNQRPTTRIFHIATATKSGEDNAQNVSPPTTGETTTNASNSRRVVANSDGTVDGTAVSSQVLSMARTSSRTRTGKTKRFSCDLCTATFSCLGNYTRHRKIHTLNLKEDKCYKCPHCERPFLQRCDMKRHLLIHTKEEPFHCQTCGKGYIRKSDLVVHERFHTKNRAFKCEECDRSFYQSGDLRRHKRAVHAQQTHLTCDHCQRKYAREVTLIRHMKTCHNDLLQSVSQQAAQKGDGT